MGGPEARRRGPAAVSEAPARHWLVTTLRAFLKVVVVNLVAEVKSDSLAWESTLGWRRERRAPEICGGGVWGGFGDLRLSSRPRRGGKVGAVFSNGGSLKLGRGAFKEVREQRGGTFEMGNLEIRFHLGLRDRINSGRYRVLGKDRSIVVFERCVRTWVSASKGSLGGEYRTLKERRHQEKADLEPESGVGEGCSGHGAQTRRPGGNGGRGSAGPGSWTSGCPSPTRPCPCAHALREGGGSGFVPWRSGALWGLWCVPDVNSCTWRLLAPVSQKTLGQIGAFLDSLRTREGAEPCSAEA
ncbi:hypothetical protein P7K49_034386 [Saguinus oedipus]|uniref:Uncharacterized protein n=1 Tax=Saguinus oedipus TaxID=9490 RepID=A0ABQ9TV62_SAGOE|nr:hypothetical protein P7K49_034386 [Saguinus oedipus]